jgi:uncharacterized protein YlxW (UPF0749 family)
MEKNPIVKEFVRKFDEVQYEIDAHHWLLAVVLFILALQLMTAWSFADLREGLIAVAARQQRTSKEVTSLQEQINALREEIVTAQRKSASQTAPSEQGQKESLISNSTSTGPGSSTSGVHQVSQQPKVKNHR